MFQRARLRLTVWYTLALLVLFLAVGVSAYLLLRRELDRDIDQSLGDGLDVLSAGFGNRRGGPADQVRNDFSGDEALAQGLSTDIFTVWLTKDGSVAVNPRRVPLTDFPLAQLVAGPPTERRISDVDANGQHFRVALQPSSQPGSSNEAYILVGRSLEARDSQLRALALIFGFGAALAAAVSAAGGFWLAGLALRPIRQTMEAQRRFVSDASHELRTPVTVIATNADILLQHPDDPVEENMEQVAAIRDSASRLTRLVGDLLTLARADEERRQFVTTELRLDEAIGLAVRDMAALAGDKGVHLEFAADAVTVRGDAERIRQLSLILLDNAIKYTPPGGNILVQCRADGRRAFLSVKDSGPGIPPEALPHVFERFYRADASRTRTGSGLGLSIAQWIAEAHDGRIGAESTLGAGATFTVQLPRLSRV